MLFRTYRTALLAVAAGILTVVIIASLPTSRSNSVVQLPPVTVHEIEAVLKATEPEGVPTETVSQVMPGSEQCVNGQTRKRVKDGDTYRLVIGGPC